MKKNQDTENQLYQIGVASIVLMLLGILVISRFPNVVAGYGFPCVFRKLTGLYCPGCGGTRAVRFFLRGKLISSFICHPLVPYMGIGGGLFMSSQSLSRLTFGKIKGMKFRNIYVYLMAVIIVVQFIVKNVLLLFWGYHII